MWNPPTGPPNDVPLRPADARREVAQAIETAQARDRELRAEIAALARRGIEVCGAIEDSTAEAAESRDLAKRALERAEESARAGQRADAARLTDAARVFALRLRDARARSCGSPADATPERVASFLLRVHRSPRSPAIRSRKPVPRNSGESTRGCSADP